VEGTRVDQWLWAVRIYKTRSAAATACRGGHVKINGRNAKAASPVNVGDEVAARVGDWERVVEVVTLISTRVGAPLAADCLVDHSPPRPRRDAVPRRDPGSGRPTKRDRRRLDRLRGR